MTQAIIDRARKDTVQAFPDAEQNLTSVAMNVFRGPTLPPWGSRLREHALRNWDRNEYNWIWQGARSGLAKKIAATEWEIEGPKTGVYNARRFQDVLRQADFGDGWSNFLKRVARDYCRFDAGAYIEIIAPGDPRKPPVGAMSGLAALDSYRCYPTGDPDYPVIYYNRDGTKHILHTSRVIHWLDMPDEDEFNPGYGECALTRAVAISEQQYYMLRYIRTEMDELPPPGFASLLNMSKEVFEKAVEEFTERKNRDSPPIYGNLVLLPGMVRDAMPKVEITTYTHAPEKFDYKVWTEVQVNAVALALGVDIQEVWQLTGGSLGSGAQSTILHEKSQGKTYGEMLASLERKLNDALPESCKFQFKPKDTHQDKVAADNASAWAGFTSAVTAESTPEERRMILANTVEAFKDAVTDAKGEIVRLPDSDVAPVQQITVDDATAAMPTASPVTVDVQAQAAKDYEDTRSSFVLNLIDLVHAQMSGDLNRRRAGTVMRAQLNSAGKQARVDGLVKGGVEDGMSDEDLAAHAVWLAAQSGYVTHFLDEIKNSGLTDKQVDARAEAWANVSLQEAYYGGLLSADKNGLYEFGGVDGMESCFQCSTLKGQRHRMKDWTAKRLRPGVDNDSFDCGGFQCQHGLEKVGGKARGNWVQPSLLRQGKEHQHNHAHEHSGVDHAL